MSLRSRFFLVALIFLLASLMVWGVAQAMPAMQTAGTRQQEPEAQEATRLPDQPDEISPDISLITSPTASCVLPKAGTGDCYLTWNYLYASANPQYMITMTVEIDSHARARYQGFFQTSMYVPSTMLNFRVSCGAPGSAGDPDFGASHLYILRARDSAGLKTANYGSVMCPADLRFVRLPLVVK